MNHLYQNCRHCNHLSYASTEPQTFNKLTKQFSTWPARYKPKITLKSWKNRIRATKDLDDDNRGTNEIYEIR